MYRRSLVALAVGLLGLVAISPVLATDAPMSPSPPWVTLLTTSSSSSSSSSSSTTPTTAVSTSSSTSSTTTPSDRSSASTTTSSTAPRSTSPTTSNRPPSSSQTCTPEATRGPAPDEGTSEVYDAADAGEVEVERTSPTDFNIVQATPNTGWTHEITGQTGPRVKVKFTNSAGPPWVVRFAASMDQKGREIHIRVTTCQ